jgi:DNA repair protein RecN (Recombination protein N)
MLAALHIQDFVLIDQARLSLAPGLTVLTGETGAGKSILLDALGLVVGARANRMTVRRGAEQCVVTAVFDVLADHPVWTFLDENGLGADDDQIILRRIVSQDGRSRGFVNEQPVSIGALRSVGDLLLEVHGQHDGRGFLSPAAHRGMLDEFGRLTEQAGAVAAFWRCWRERQSALEERRREQATAAREADYLRHVGAALDALNPQRGEETALADRRAQLMASEKIAENLNAAASAMDEGAIDAQLSAALRHVDRAVAQAGGDAGALGVAAESLERAINELAEARAAMSRAADAFGAGSQTLEETEERLFALRREARKHGVSPDMLQDVLDRTKKTLAGLELGEKAFWDLERAVAQAKADYETAASALSRARKKTAKALDGAVAKELASLKLGRAAFFTDVKTDLGHPASEGVDRVEFMVATNPGAPAGPLQAIASGGELSRFVLAMKAALAAKEDRTVIIFDEVDAGVGGAVADAVGERLARLARDAQVLVVTHSPQVAARAGDHWRIEKTQKAKTTTTLLSRLSDCDRIEEIARMLSGAKVTDEARAAARRLLDAPPQERPVRKRA